ncbi:Hsp90 protein [Catonella morbi ATCC 51271]|uniref:Hsp90 protein n=2 Tax=Catonella TaxID=43996 RepID=V2XNU2_9FIRM|nr:Hsp90 protein [Catonella morbi ATCC 51271]
MDKKYKTNNLCFRQKIYEYKEKNTMGNIEKGSLSITSENIFPIIKKWLYSDHDIFLRELVSNACDAITKLKKLDGIGEWKAPEDNKFRVDVITDSEAKTITVIDNGIGMTADEVKTYINQIAFSGAQSFLEKYKDKASEEQIIGHFGLGFYSAFMVARRVTIDTLSYKEGEKAVHWASDEGVDFTMEDGDRTERGTKITLYLNDDCYEFANEYRVKEILEKYCSFMPVEIYYTNSNAIKTEKTEVVEDKEGEKKEEAPKPVNEIHPLWTKHPNEVKEEDYKEFYRKVFRDYKEPLFWIHLNMDYPFNLKGILYFPKINNEYEAAEGTIKLYNNQVFIADNIKEVIPEFLLLLKGVIDCPDLPLNVSRSALQNDGFVKKISDYITKKVAEKLSGLCKTDRENYEKYWDDISPFIKYGCLKDDKFEEKMKEFILFKDLNDKYVTFDDYVKTIEPEKEEAEEKPEEENKEDAEVEPDKPKKIIYYVTDVREQSQYINMFKEHGLNAVVLSHRIDQPFMNALEMKNDDLKFERIDSKVNASAKNDIPEEELKTMTDSLSELFKKALGKEKLEVKVESLKNENVSSMMTVSEEMRRMQEMMKQYGMGTNPFEAGEVLVLNSNNALVKYLLEHKEEVDNEKVKIFCEQLYDLAAIANRPLEPEAMTKFITRSNEVLKLLAE